MVQYTLGEISAERSEIIFQKKPNYVVRSTATISSRYSRTSCSTDSLSADTFPVSKINFHVGLEILAKNSSQIIFQIKEEEIYKLNIALKSVKQPQKMCEYIKTYKSGTI